MSHERKRSRKAVKLPDSLHRELAGYVLAASAVGVSVMALAPPSEGQIVYTPAHERIERNGTILIDLNHDGIADVTIREIPWNYGGGRSFRGNSVQAVIRGGGGIVFEIASNLAAQLACGAGIGPPGPFHSGVAIMDQETSFGTYYGGFWEPGTVGGFLGIRFRVGSETHYGWARFNTIIGPPRKGIGVMLTGYAYETQHDTPIRAGDTGSDAPEENPDPTSEMFPAPKPEAKQAGLGALALGAGGLALLRPAH